MNTGNPFNTRLNKLKCFYLEWFKENITPLCCRVPYILITDLGRDPLFALKEIVRGALDVWELDSKNLHAYLDIMEGELEQFKQDLMLREFKSFHKSFLMAIFAAYTLYVILFNKEEVLGKGKTFKLIPKTANVYLEGCLIFLGRFDNLLIPFFLPSSSKKKNDHFFIFVFPIKKMTRASFLFFWGTLFIQITQSC